MSKQVVNTNNKMKDNTFYGDTKWQPNMNVYKTARERGERFKVVAKDVKQDFAAKCYLRISPSTELAEIFAKHDIHGYEMINEEQPARLMFDLDFESRRNGIDEPDMLLDQSLSPEFLVNTFFERFEKYVNHLTCDTQDWVKKRCLLRCIRPDKPWKHSFHIIFPTAVFKCMTDMKLFVLGFGEWCFGSDEQRWQENKIMAFRKKAKNGNILGRCIFDLAIYTKDRVFRGIGQSKFTSKNAKMEMMDTLAYKPEDTIVQPVEYITEPESVNCKVGNELYTLSLQRWQNVKLRTCVARYEARVSNVVKDGNMKVTKETKCANIIVDKKGKMKVDYTEMKMDGVAQVFIHTDEDFLKYLDSRMLKDVSYGSDFLSVITSLALSVPRNMLIDWCSTSGINSEQKYGKMIDRAKEKAKYLPITGHKAYRILCDVYGKENVIDLRRGDQIHTPCIIKNAESIITAADKWTPVRSKEELTKMIDSILKQNRQVENAEFISETVTIF